MHSWRVVATPLSSCSNGVKVSSSSSSVSARCCQVKDARREGDVVVLLQERLALGVDGVRDDAALYAAVFGQQAQQQQARGAGARRSTLGLPLSRELQEERLAQVAQLGPSVSAVRGSGTLGRRLITRAKPIGALAALHLAAHCAAACSSSDEPSAPICRLSRRRPSCRGHLEGEPSRRGGRGWRSPPRSPPARRRRQSQRAS